MSPSAAEAVVPQVVVPEVTACDALMPAMVEEFTAEGAQELCVARRTILGCGGCACAQLTEIATNDPGLRHHLGHQIKEAMHQGGAE